MSDISSNTNARPQQDQQRASPQDQQQGEQLQSRPQQDQQQASPQDQQQASPQDQQPEILRPRNENIESTAIFDNRAKGG